ncbi:hypothetical protein SNEBB_004816 [Seison nebaliae]|nr:hypothetical protein SNEBB_004816 [Seison nebaliae]
MSLKTMRTPFRRINKPPFLSHKNQNSTRKKYYSYSNQQTEQQRNSLSSSSNSTRKKYKNYDNAYPYDTRNVTSYNNRNVTSYENTKTNRKKPRRSKYKTDAESSIATELLKNNCNSASYTFRPFCAINESRSRRMSIIGGGNDSRSNFDTRNSEKHNCDEIKNGVKLSELSMAHDRDRKVSNDTGHRTMNGGDHHQTMHAGDHRAMHGTGRSTMHSGGLKPGNVGGGGGLVVPRSISCGYSSDLDVLDMISKLSNSERCKQVQPQPHDMDFISLLMDTIVAFYKFIISILLLLLDQLQCLLNLADEGTRCLLAKWSDQLEKCLKNPCPPNECPPGCVPECPPGCVPQCPPGCVPQCPPGCVPQCPPRCAPQCPPKCVSQCPPPCYQPCPPFNRNHEGHYNNCNNVKCSSGPCSMNSISSIDNRQNNNHLRKRRHKNRSDPYNLREELKVFVNERMNQYQNNSCHNNPIEEDEELSLFGNIIKYLKPTTYIDFYKRLRNCQ